MSRKTTIALTGIALLAGIALIENATRSDDILPATVTEILSTPGTEGPDLWTLRVTLRDGTAADIDTAGIRPSQQIGDTLCVKVMKRSWAKTKYIVASPSDC